MPKENILIYSARLEILDPHKKLISMKYNGCSFRPPHNTRKHEQHPPSLWQQPWQPPTGGHLANKDIL